MRLTIKKGSSIELPCGERGIRTPGGVTLNGFQDRRNRPLCHLSNRGCVSITGAKVNTFFISHKFFFNFFSKKIFIDCYIHKLSYLH